MEARNKTGEVSPLQYLYVDEAMYMLGVYLALDGNNDDQVQYMYKKKFFGKFILEQGLFNRTKQ